MRAFGLSLLVFLVFPTIAMGAEPLVDEAQKSERGEAADTAPNANPDEEPPPDSGGEVEAGGEESMAGDPPSAWLMPLVGDAVVGLSALVIAGLIVFGSGLAVWTTIVVWNVVGIWDALSAFLIHASDPWPEFFMVETFGASLFFIASAMHVVNLALISRDPLRAHYLDR